MVAGLSLILLSNMLGVEYPAIPLVYSVFLMPVIIIGFNHPFYQFNFPLALTYGYGLLILNDILLRYYSDTVSGIDERWISYSFLASFVLSTILMLYMAIVTGKQARKANAKAFCEKGRCALLFALGAAVALCYYFFIQGSVSPSFQL